MSDKEVMLKDIVETEGDFTEEEIKDLVMYMSCMAEIEKIANKGLIDMKKGKKTFMVRLASQILLDIIEKEIREDTDGGYVFKAILETGLPCDNDCKSCSRKNDHVGGIC